jgi:hypothetical protein
MKLNAKTLLLGGLAVAAAAGALKNRQKVAGLLGARSSVPEAPPQPTGPRATPAPAPVPSNYDAPGPPENTATPVPAPEPVDAGGIDEAAEEAAAAAEAAAIGGPAPEYTDFERAHADEELRGVLEGGGGESEGQELAEAALIDNAEPAAGDPIDAERQIDEIIEQQEDPFAGEIVEPGGGIDADYQEADIQAGASGGTVLSDDETPATGGASFTSTQDTTGATAEPTEPTTDDDDDVPTSGGLGAASSGTDTDDDVATSGGLGAAASEPESSTETFGGGFTAPTTPEDPAPPSAEEIAPSEDASLGYSTPPEDAPETASGDDDAPETGYSTPPAGDADTVEGVPASAFEDTPASTDERESDLPGGSVDNAGISTSGPAPTAETGEEASGATETPAAEKSAAVWGAPTPEEREKDSQTEPLWKPPGSAASSEDADDDDGGSEWQTWSGKAIEP